MTFDYVVFNEGTGVEIETTLAVISYTMEMLREANPNVKFIFLVPHLVYTGTTYSNLRVALKEGEALGLTMVDLGCAVGQSYSFCTKKQISDSRRNAFPMRPHTPPPKRHGRGCKGNSCPAQSLREP